MTPVACARYRFAVGAGLRRICVPYPCCGSWSVRGRIAGAIAAALRQVLEEAMQTGAWPAARTKVCLKLGVYGWRCAIRGAGRCYLAAPYAACHTCDLGCSFTTFRGGFSLCLRDDSGNPRLRLGID